MSDTNPENSTDQYFELQSRQEDDTSIDDLIGEKARILTTKLEVLALEIHERLRIRLHNLARIADDKDQTSQMLWELDKRANYLSRQHREKAPFYDQLFKLDQERRMQDTECWRDIVMVMRDLLFAWEAHEQAKARAIFLDHV